MRARRDGSDTGGLSTPVHAGKPGLALVAGKYGRTMVPREQARMQAKRRLLMPEIPVNELWGVGREARRLEVVVSMVAAGVGDKDLCVLEAGAEAHSASAGPAEVACAKGRDGRQLG